MEKYKKKAHCTEEQKEIANTLIIESSAQKKSETFLDCPFWFAKGAWKRKTSMITCIVYIVAQVNNRQIQRNNVC